MKMISDELNTHLQGEVTTLATCWKVTRTDDVVMGFTDHDSDIVYDSVTYQAATGFNPSDITGNSNLEADYLDVEGMLSSAGISEEDILAGRYDAAAIEIFKVNYTNLTQGILKLKKGWFGEVSLRDHQFTTGIRGLADKLSQTIGELYSPSCRAQLGDARCKVNMATHTATGTVTATTSRLAFTDSARTEAAGDYSLGTVTFDSGANAGLSMEIKEYLYSSATGGTIILTLAMPYAIGVGDSYTITKGCDKTLATCKQKFNNTINFRGEPHVPGLDKILQTAGTRSEW